MLHRLIAVPLVMLVALFAVPQLQAQDTPDRPCVFNWPCGAVRPPLGLYIDTVTAGGRYITLEDGTRWEVQLDHRARAAGWTGEDFVEIRRIDAPTGHYEWRFTKVDDPEGDAAVRLVGRSRP